MGAIWLIWLVLIILSILVAVPRLLKYWKPIAPPGQSVAPPPQAVGSAPQTGISENAAAAARAPQITSPTVELPITPAISAVIARELARQQRFMANLAMGVSLLGLVLGLIGRFALLAVFGLVVGLIVKGIGMFFDRRLQRDQHDSTHLRTSGPVQLVTVRFGYGGGTLLRLWDRTFMVNPPVVKALRGVTWATIDHSQHAHVVFEVRDRTGRSLYSIVGPTDVVDPSSGTVYSIPNPVSAVPGTMANPQPPAPPPQSPAPVTVANREPIAQSEMMAPPVAAGSSSKTKFCQECGKPIPRSSKFCSECGKVQG